MAPLVSVVISSYNYGRYLKAALDGVLGQDFPAGEMEVIVVDDGSSDDSEEVARPYLDRIRWIAIGHAGQGAALEAGFRASSGRLIATMDSDDLWEPGKLGKVAALYRARPELGMIQHRLRVIGPPHPDFGEFHPSGPLPATFTLDDFLAGRTRFAPTSGLVFVREHLEKILPVPESLVHSTDVYLYTHILFYADAGNIDEALGSYRLHGDNQMLRLAANPAEVLRHMRFVHACSAALDERLRAFGRDFAPERRAAEETDRLKRAAVLSRIDGDWAGAFSAYRGFLARPLPLGTRLFGAATLALGLLSPTVYLALMGLYARARSG